MSLKDALAKIENIDSLSFDEIYKNLEYYYRSDLTSTLMRQGIDPLQDMTRVPSYYCDSPLLTELNVPYGIQYIGRQAFADCPKLTKVILPPSVKEIKQAAFSTCERLSDVTFSNGLTYIGEDAFYKTAITDIKIPDSVRIIDNGAFSECYALDSVDLGKNVTHINEYVFYNSNLDKVKMPTSVQKIGGLAFLRCMVDDFRYEGTKEQWSQIDVAADAFGLGDIIHCKDGDIVIQRGVS